MLTTEQKTALNNEIANDPTGKGYAGMLPDRPGYVVDALNAKTETKLGEIDRPNLTIWAVKTGMLAAVKDESEDKLSPLRSSALAILHVLMGASTGINFENQENIDTLNAWIAIGKLSVEHKDLMLSMATHPASRAEILGLPHMTVDLFLTRNQ